MFNYQDKILAVFVFTIFIYSFSTINSEASCTWKWDCSSGQCQQVPICDSSIDIVPPKTPEVAPIPTPTIQPIGNPTVPPVGTTQCGQKYICEANGCSWQTVCQ